MAGWNTILGRTSNHSVHEAQEKMVEKANRIMQETRRINAQAKSAGLYSDMSPPDSTDTLSSDVWRMRSLAMRLRVKEGHKMPFQHISTAWSGDKVFIFVISKGQPVTFEDDVALFPSDTIITALRLVQE